MRVDILYGNVDERRKAMIDIFGVLVILLPACTATWWVSWEYVANAWAVREGSIEVSGIQAVYLLKTCILLFAGLVALQGVSLLVKSCWIVAGRRELAGLVEEQEEHGL